MRIIKSAVIVALALVIALSSAYNTPLFVYAATGASEDALISGIVRENNPALGYITLYFKDGSGTDPEDLDRLVAQRTYTYGYEIPVLRDGQTVPAERIQPGDQVFIKLDAEGYIIKLSAKSYYQPIYGLVHNKSIASLVIKRDNGTYSYYPINSSIPVYKNGRPGTHSDIKPGERIKLLVQTNGESMDIAGIEIEKNSMPITGVFRGHMEFYDTLRDALHVSGVQEFVNGRWENTQVKGIQSISFMSDYKGRPGKKATGTAYYVTAKAKDGTSRIQMASYRYKPQYELLLKDNLVNLAGNNRLELQNTSYTVGYDTGTLVVKDGKLVDMGALVSLDPVKMSLEKAGDGNTYVANIVVSDSLVNEGLSLYRGRIKSVDKEKSLTVESFAQLGGITWTFTNTPKTFDIDLSSSRLLVDGGIGSMREVDASYIGQTVYIVAVGTKITLMSTAPYADAPASGRILSLAGATYDEAGQVLTPPTGLSLTEAMVFNTSSYQWTTSQNITLDIPAHAIVIKRGQVGSTALLKPGDQIKVMRHAQNLNGIIILCD